MSDIRIKTRDNEAKAYYRQEGTGQFSTRPVVVGLKKTELGWTVVSEKWDKTWWWDIVNHTIGVK
jgi:hypothetical protein